jgi:formylglycine-generating enzyme required for sulfatase activity
MYTPCGLPAPKRAVSVYNCLVVFFRRGHHSGMSILVRSFFPWSAMAVLLGVACAPDNVSPTQADGGGDDALRIACTNGIKDGAEADVDCGGGCPKKCATGTGCTAATDCDQGVCGAAVARGPGSDAAVEIGGGNDAGAPKPAGVVNCTSATPGACVCLAGTANDSVRNGDETGIDCGGSAAPKCGFDNACSSNNDCRSALCKDGKCAASAGDGQRDGDESDVDCGGVGAPSCADLRRCKVASDCSSRSCVGGICQSATHTDGVVNPGETDIDCGGADPLSPRCTVNQMCAVRSDCLTNSCSVQNRCQQPAINGVKDGDESDVDCGGTLAPPCVPGKRCGTPKDCDSNVCGAGVCIAATNKDNTKNGDESDVDCGGTVTAAARCVVGKTCNKSADCLSDACSYDKKCVQYKSCTGLHGGVTCGAGEYGQPGASHESCCATATVAAADAPGGGYVIDKYQITAGRMRQFIDRVNGNVRGYIQAHRPANWDPAWDAFLPISMQGAPGAMGAGPTEYALKASSVWHQLSYALFYAQAGTQGCYLSGVGTHTYWMPNAVQAQLGDINHRYSQEVMDEKPVNCVTALMVAAFCEWDGGRPAKIEELDYLWKGFYPWGAAPKAAGYNLSNGQKSPADGDLTFANYLYAYQYPLRANANEPDYSSFIAAPGRFPKGAGKNGVMDLGGNLFDVTYIAGAVTGESPQTRLNRWSRSGSWEGHSVPYSVVNTSLLTRYGKVGGRCVRPRP